MICRINRWLTPLLDDVPAILQKFLRRHQETCQRCVKQRNKQLHTVEKMRHLAEQDAPPELPHTITESIITAVNREFWPHTPAFLRPVAVWSIAAACIIAIVGSHLFRKQYQEHNTRSVDQNPLYLESAIPDTLLQPYTLEEFELLMSRLYPNQNMTDEELDRKYPLVESIQIPDGIQVVCQTEDPNLKIIGILPQAGGTL